MGSMVVIDRVQLINEDSQTRGRPMIDKLRDKLTYANVMSTLAVFLVLGGGVAFAAKSVVNNTQDVAPQSITNSDVKKESLKSNRLKNGAAVGDQDVIPNSLTGNAINESTLSLSPSGAAGGDLAGSYPNPELGSGVVGAAEEADRERRIVIDPASMIGGTPPASFGSASFGMQVVSFDPDADTSVVFSTEVPFDRAPGSGMQVRLFWDANGTGNATWNTSFASLAPGDATVGPSGGADIPATSSPVNTINKSLVLDIPAAAVENGEDLALEVRRNADVPSDTLTVFSRLRLVEISYTAAG